MPSFRLFNNLAWKTKFFDSIFIVVSSLSEIVEVELILELNWMNKAIETAWHASDGSKRRPRLNSIHLCSAWDHHMGCYISPQRRALWVPTVEHAIWKPWWTRKECSAPMWLLNWQTGKSGSSFSSEQCWGQHTGKKIYTPNSKINPVSVNPM